MHICFIHDKGGTLQSSCNHTVFLINDTGPNIQLYIHREKMKLFPYLTQIIQIISPDRL